MGIRVLRPSLSEGGGFSFEDIFAIAHCEVNGNALFCFFYPCLLLLLCAMARALTIAPSLSYLCLPPVCPFCLGEKVDSPSPFAFRHIPLIRKMQGLPLLFRFFFFFGLCFSFISASERRKGKSCYVCAVVTIVTYVVVNGILLVAIGESKR